MNSIDDKLRELEQLGSEQTKREILLPEQKLKNKDTAQTSDTISSSSAKINIDEQMPKHIDNGGTVDSSGLEW